MTEFDVSEEPELANANSNVNLRGYQQELVDGVCKLKNSLVVAPTGSGKTLVAAEVIRVSKLSCMLSV